MFSNWICDYLYETIDQNRFVIDKKCWSSFWGKLFKRKPMLTSSKLKQTVLHDWYLTGSMGNVLKESCNMLLDCLLKFIRFVLNIWSIFIIWGIRWFIFSIEMINWYKSWYQRIIHVSEIRNYNNMLDGTPIFGYTTNTFYYKEQW